MNNTKSVPYTIKTNGSVVVFLSSGCETIANDHPNYNKVIDAIKAGDFSNIENLINVAKAVTSYAGGRVSIQNGQVFYGSFALHNTLTTRILKMMNEGFKFEHMLVFLDNLMQNPSNRAVNETYTFLENYGLPITDDGCFLAYKAVRNDYRDIYSGKLDNSIGKVVSMPRNMVDEEYARDCSTGLHVGALDYVVQYGHFSKGAPVREGGNHLLIVKVNPKNVVSVPQYESHPKMRVCEYTVVSEINDVVKELDKVVYTSKATTLTPDRPAATATKTSPAAKSSEITDPAKYDLGWEDAQDDLDNGDEYGTSRNYSEVESYRLGYNDCFNGREYAGDPDYDMTPFASKHSTPARVVDTTSPYNEAKYVEGWEDAAYDIDNGHDYGTNRDYSEENSYRLGYNDRFNGRPNRAEPQVSGGCPDCKWPADSSDAADSDYNRGYTCGYDDAEAQNGFQFNLDIDASDEFKDGYEDGYNEYSRG